jgi:hypothetical protein
MAGGIICIVAGLITLLAGHIQTSLLQGVGKMLCAQVDCAVNGSHFLDDDERVKVMSLE